MMCPIWPTRHCDLIHSGMSAGTMSWDAKALLFVKAGRTARPA